MIPREGVICRIYPNHFEISAIILYIDYKGQLKRKVTMSLQACLTPASSKNNRNMSVHLLLHKNLYKFGIQNCPS